MKEEYAVETHGLTKAYGDFKALDNLNLRIRKNTVFGYVGPNGAGKSTTFNLLLGLIAPTSGSAKVGGFDVQKGIYEVRKIIGALPDGYVNYQNITGAQNLDFFADLAGSKNRTAELLKLVGLSEFADKLVSTYSRGMKQKLGIAQALVRDPQIIFLDEPFNGLDPIASRQIRDFLKSLSKNKTIIICSHNLAEIQQIADEIGVLKEGKLIAQGSLKELAKKMGVKTLEEVYIKLQEAQKA